MTISAKAAGEPVAMSDPVFADFKFAVAYQFERMNAHPMFRTGVSGDDLWETYLASFPPETNPVYRKRSVHDCGCCRNFIRTMGNVVAVVDGTLVSLWDFAGIPVHPAYEIVAEAIALKVRSAPIDNLFVHHEYKVGTDHNHENAPEGVKTWSHFSVELTKRNERKIVYGKHEIGPLLSEARACHDVLLRSLTELSVEAVETVRDLIKEGSLYRGEEHLHAVEAFLGLRRPFDAMPEARKDQFVWQKSREVHGSVAKIRNTSIGQLLIDLSAGRELEDSVKAYERIVAPQNYKRPRALVSRAMLDRAREAVEKLGMTSALERRFATLADVSVNNVIWADRSARAVMKRSVFDEIATKPTKPKGLDNAQEVTVEAFLNDILPGATSLELMVENRHAGNFVSLIAPADPASKSLFQWENRFSWSYAGDFADSVKERVKRAGGSVTGDLCCRLAWSNFDDLDLHMMEPGKPGQHSYEIYFRNKGMPSPSGGTLDVDMNAGRRETRTPVENIFYPSKARMADGLYQLFVHQFSQREAVDTGFEVEIDIEGAVHRFRYDQPLRQDQKVVVADIVYSQKTGFQIVRSLPSSTVSRKLWNIDTEAFQRVNVVLFSPNHWDGRGVGNRHYFFMLDGCQNDGSARGFYNEFLSPELKEHRKVFEMLGAKMRAEMSPDQLSGLGFSSTQRNEMIARVSGVRTVRVTF